MTDEMILATLSRLEAKLDGIVGDSATTRESLARVQVRQEESAKGIAALGGTVASNSKRITALEGFRFQILGAIAAGTAIGGVLGAVIAVGAQVFFGG